MQFIIEQILTTEEGFKAFLHVVLGLGSLAVFVAFVILVHD